MTGIFGPPGNLIAAEESVQGGWFRCHRQTASMTHIRKTSEASVAAHAR